MPADKSKLCLRLCMRKKTIESTGDTVTGESIIERTRYDSYLRLYEKAALIKEWEIK